MIKCNSYKRILDQDSHYIEKLNYELGGWTTIKNVLNSNPNLVSNDDAKWVNENANKAILKYNYGIETVLDDYKKIPKDRPVQFYFDAGYVGWYDENKEDNNFEPCPPHIGFNTSYAQMYPDSNRTKNVTIVVTEDCPLLCSYCVSGDTRIRMANYSEVPISEIKIGDSVLGFEEFVEKGKHTNLMPGVVTNVFHRKSPVHKIEFENGEHLFITGNHKLLTSRVGKHRWKEASKITTKNMVKALPSVPRKSFESFGEYRALLNTKVKSTEFIKEEIDVYNIETTCRTYIANNIGVHNCYQHNKNKTYMTSARACEIVDFLFKQDLKNSELVNSDVANGLIIEFIGGEPLMAMDTINAFMEHFLSTAIKLRHRWATRYMISISSNGVLYDTPKVQEFVEKYKARLSLNITIDGNKTLHDSCRVFRDGSPSYDIVERSVKKHLTVAPYSSTKLTLSPENIVYTSDAIKNLFTNVGLHVVFANCIFEDGWTLDPAKTLYWQMKDLANWLIDNDFENKYYCSLFSDFIGHPIPPEDNNSYCGGTGAMLSFTADGGIQPCLRYCAFNLNGKQPELRIGTVQDGLLSTDEQKKVFADLKSITRRSQSTDECFYCPIASGCAYCSAHNYEEYGTANKRTTAICPMHKARVLANYYYWNKLYQKRDVDKRVKIDIPNDMATEIIGTDEFAMIKDI